MVVAGPGLGSRAGLPAGTMRVEVFCGIRRCGTHHPDTAACAEPACLHEACLDLVKKIVWCCAAVRRRAAEHPPADAHTAHVQLVPHLLPAARAGAPGGGAATGGAHVALHRSPQGELNALGGLFPGPESFSWRLIVALAQASTDGLTLGHDQHTNPTVDSVCPEDAHGCATSMAGRALSASHSPL